MPKGRWRRRRLHLSPTAFGMVRIDGDLDPETGETVLTAVRACVDGASGQHHRGTLTGGLRTRPNPRTTPGGRSW